MWLISEETRNTVLIEITKQPLEGLIHKLCNFTHIGKHKENDYLRMLSLGVICFPEPDSANLTPNRNLCHQNVSRYRLKSQ